MCRDKAGTSDQCQCCQSLFSQGIVVCWPQQWWASRHCMLLKVFLEYRRAIILEYNSDGRRKGCEVIEVHAVCNKGARIRASGSPCFFSALRRPSTDDVNSSTTTQPRHPHRSSIRHELARHLSIAMCLAICFPDS